MEPDQIQPVESTANSGESQAIEVKPEVEKDAVRDPETGRFLPGHSGNPPGPRPGYKHLSTKLREVLKNRTVEWKGAPTPAEDAIIDKVVDMALNGNERMVNLVWDRIEGKPTQPVTYDGDKENIDQLAELLRALGKPPKDAEPRQIAEENGTITIDTTPGESPAYTVPSSPDPGTVGSGSQG